MTDREFHNMPENASGRDNLAGMTLDCIAKGLCVMEAGKVISIKLHMFMC